MEDKQDIGGRRSKRLILKRNKEIGYQMNHLTIHLLNTSIEVIQEYDILQFPLLMIFRHS